MNIFLQVFFGFIGGIFGGLGMGGGTLLIPLITIFLGFDQKLSQGINLITFLVMAIFSLAIHSRNNLIETKGIAYIIFGGILSTIIGSLFATMLSGVILKRLFGAFLCVLAIDGFVKVFKKPKNH